MVNRTAIKILPVAVYSQYGPYFRDNYENIVFSLHVYSLWNDAEDRFEEYIGEVKQIKLAFLFGEYGESDRYNESSTEGTAPLSGIS